MGRQSLTLALILALALVGAWQWYESQQREQALQAQLQLMENRVSKLQQRLDTLEGQVTSLRESSVEGLVNDANTAILEGWESLVDTVEDELKKARKALRDEYFPPDNAPEKPQSGEESEKTPRLESPDGTDRT